MSASSRQHHLNDASWKPHWFYRAWILAALTIFTGCTPPNPNASPLQLPTRAHRTPTPTLLDAKIYYEAALAYQKAGDTENALQAFTWAIRLEPTSTSAYVGRGAVYLAQGKLYLALADADRALKIDQDNAAAHALRGESLRLQGRGRSASRAFDRALALNPTLSAETFQSRWLAARATPDSNRLLALGGEYADAHPEDPLRHYYRGWAFIELGAPRVAISILVEGIEAASDPPALLWFTLGQAYAANNSWREAVASFEVCRALVQADDTSLKLHSTQPIPSLFAALGRAYLGAGRCADAEMMLKYAAETGNLDAAYDTALEEARVCQTPTPAATPYLTTTPSTP